MSNIIFTISLVTIKELELKVKESEEKATHLDEERADLITKVTPHIKCYIMCTC